ncbi:hypothetical protein [Streptosporangium sp. NPDC050280]|uniref:hypothetical protein n=1 Tax=unclassified Streptosporangium TaxID=2632669 RepID=UPI00343CF261
MAIPTAPHQDTGVEQVVAFLVQPPQPLQLPGTAQVGVRRGRQVRVVRGVRLAARLGLAGLGQPFGAVRADGLQHPLTRSPA